MIQSRKGRIVVNPLQAPERDEDPGDEGAARVSTDPWGVTRIAGLNGEKRSGEPRRQKGASR